MTCELCGKQFDTSEIMNHLREEHGYDEDIDPIVIDQTGEPGGP